VALAARPEFQDIFVAGMGFDAPNFARDGRRGPPPAAAVSG
jgi:hypothetical protein